MRDELADNPVRLTLYMTKCCHLCETMVQELNALQVEFAFTLDQIEIDSDDGLVHEFGQLIPVLLHGDVELCRYRLDAPTVSRYLSAQWPN